MDIIDVRRGTYKEIVVGTPEYVVIENFAPPLGIDVGWIQSDFRIHAAEKNSVIQCFNDINHIYAFGHDPDGSSFSVTYIVFLGERVCEDKDDFTASDTFKTFRDSYARGRISVTKNICNMTFGDGGYVKVMVTGCDASVYDEEMHAVSFTVNGKILSLE